MNKLHKLAYVLLFAGGLNWGLIGLFNFDLVEAIFGSWPGLVTLVYVLVGVATVYLAFGHKGYCKFCSEQMKV